MRILFLYCLFYFAANITAQPTQLSGTVTDKASRTPMSGVLVTIRPAGETKIVKFTQTSPNGTVRNRSHKSALRPLRRHARANRRVAKAT